MEGRGWWRQGEWSNTDSVDFDLHTGGVGAGYGHGQGASAKLEVEGEGQSIDIYVGKLTTKNGNKR